jgi:hypothetical protein
MLFPFQCFWLERPIMLTVSNDIFFRSGMLMRDAMLNLR